MPNSRMNNKTLKDSSHEFKMALRKGDNSRFLLRLFVTGMTPTSLRAIERVRHLCETDLKGRCDLEIVDIYQDPKAARDNQLFASPTLIKQLPPPLRRIVGSMADRDRILAGLDIKVITPGK